MKLEITNIKSFINLFGALKPVIEGEIMIYVKSDHLVINQMDATRTILVNMFIGKEFFDGFQTNEAEEILCFQMDVFMKLLQSFSKAKRLKIESSKEKMVFVTKKSTGRKKMSIPLLEPLEDDELKEPKVDFASIVKIKSEEFYDALKSASSIVSSEGVIKIQTEGFKLSVSIEGDMGKYDENWTFGENLEALLQEPAQSSFFLPSLLSLIKEGRKINDEVTLSLATDLPLKITFNFEQGFIEYYIAPMII